MNEFGVEEKKSESFVLHQAPQVAIDYGYIYLEDKKGQIFVFPKNALVVEISPQNYSLTKKVYHTYKKRLFGGDKLVSERIEYALEIYDAFFKVSHDDYYKIFRFSDLSESQVKSFAEGLGVDIQGFLDRYIEPQLHCVDKIEDLPANIREVLKMKWGVAELKITREKRYIDDNGEPYPIFSEQDFAKFYEIS